MKALVNSLFSFEINNEKTLDIVRVNDYLFNIIYNEKSYMVSLLSNDKKNKAFEIVINNNLYAVQLKDDFDELLLRLGPIFMSPKKTKMWFRQCPVGSWRFLLVLVTLLKKETA